jgi:RND family efflux transporter MFP subunit
MLDPIIGPSFVQSLFHLPMISVMPYANWVSSLATVVLFAAAGLLMGCGSEPKSTPPPVRTVQTQEARAAATVADRSFSGTLRAPLETNLSFRVSGTVTDVAVDVGSGVEAGEVVARLDPTDYRLQVESARARFREAQAAAENARAEFRRMKALYANDNASLSAYDQARTRYETSQERAEAAGRQLALARKRLGYTRLEAPASGTVAGTRVEEGETVSVGRPVVRLTAGKRLEVQVQVPETLISEIEVGQPARVGATPRRDTAVAATVTEVGTATDGRRPTYPVVVTLDRSVEKLRSGMTARVSFRYEAARGLVVPAEAVSRDENGRFVYVVAADSLTSTARADGRVERQAVTTGDLTPDGIVVTGGLREGQSVVTAGLSQVRPGDLVRISRLLSEQ